MAAKIARAFKPPPSQKKRILRKIGGKSRKTPTGWALAIGGNESDKCKKESPK